VFLPECRVMHLYIYISGNYVHIVLKIFHYNSDLKFMKMLHINDISIKNDIDKGQREMCCSNFEPGRKIFHYLKVS
jgi:hypothetical protein